MRTRTILITLSLVFIIAIPFVTKGREDTGPGSVRVIRDQPYTLLPNQSQSLDLYLPTKASKVPLIVFIHGGAWLQGDKAEAKDIALLLAQAGFAVASINYRLTNQAVFPAQIDDCRAAVSYLRKRAADYNFDGDRIGVWGVSAGGHLAALLGTDQKFPDTTGSAVQAVCDWCGPTNLVSVAGQAGSRTKIDYDSKDGPVALLLGGLASEKVELAKQASPITFVSKDDPPILIVHGDIDDLVPFAQSEEFIARLDKEGVPAKLITLQGMGHNLGSDQELKRVIEFFKQTLKDGKRNFQPEN